MSEEDKEVYEESLDRFVGDFQTSILFAPFGVGFSGAIGKAAPLLSKFTGKAKDILGKASKYLGKSADKVDDLAGGVAGNSRSVLLNSSKQLQAKFKHAVDFGVEGNYNKINAARFSSAINQHINSQDIKVIWGTYHRQPAIHYLNPNTGLNVISTPNGQFWSGWKLSGEQMQNVLKHGGL